MACQYYDSGKKMCKRSTQLVPVNPDRITQYCKGNYGRCPNYNSADTSYSWNESAKNRQAQNRGNNIRMLAPLAFIAVLLLCLLKLQLPLPQSIGAAVFAAILVLLFTNRYHSGRTD